MKALLKVGDDVIVKGNDYGSFRIKEFMPMGYEGRKCQLVKVLHSSTLNDKEFKFAFVKTFRLVDLRLKVQP